MNDTTKQKLMNQLCVLKADLYLEPEAKEMFVNVLISIDFKNCETDLEMLQLFFKRIYAGIAELKKRNTELREEVKLLKEQVENLKQSPQENLSTKEN